MESFSVYNFVFGSPMVVALVVCIIMLPIIVWAFVVEEKKVGMFLIIIGIALFSIIEWTKHIEG